MNTILCVRHGEAGHNELYNKIGESAYTDERVYDPELTLNGINQCNELNKQILNIPDIDIVLVSPLVRTLDTRYHILKNYKQVPIIALDDLIEYPNTIDTPNKRKDIYNLQQRYIDVNFSNIKNNTDIIWNSYQLETIDNLNIRINRIISFIKNNYQHKKILIVGHSTWISYLLYQKEIELEHCKIYNTVL